MCSIPSFPWYSRVLWNVIPQFIWLILSFFLCLRISNVVGQLIIIIAADKIGGKFWNISAVALEEEQKERLKTFSNRVIA